MTACPAKWMACWLLPALPVGCHRGHRFRQPGRQHGPPGRVRALLADLADGPEDHVIDQGRVDRSRAADRRGPLLAVREVLFGNHRFSQIARNTGAPRDRLAARLKALVRAGVLEKREYSGTPPRSDYHLTRAGRELTPVLQAPAGVGRQAGRRRAPHRHPAPRSPAAQPYRLRHLRPARAPARRPPGFRHPRLGHHRTSAGRSRYQPADAAAVITKLAVYGTVVPGPLRAHRASIAADVRVRERAPAGRVTPAAVRLGSARRLRASGASDRSWAAGGRRGIAASSAPANLRENSPVSPLHD